MTHLNDSPLERIIDAIRATYGFQPESVAEAEALVAERTDREGCDQDELAGALMLLGFAHRELLQDHEACGFYVKAHELYSRDPYSESPGVARTLWLLASSHYRAFSFDTAEELYRDAVRAYCASIGINSDEGRACLADFLEFARGIVKSDDLADEVEEIIAFADWAMHENYQEAEAA
ncbi:MAG: tetratricopeptide repeat protein [Candidatus Obscuribacterales bacterium]